MSFDLQWLDPIQAPNQTMPNTTNFGEKPEKAKNIFNEPWNLSWRQLIGKIWIGLLVGWIIAALLFIVTTFIGWMLDSAIKW